MEEFRSQLQRINETVRYADLVGIFSLSTEGCLQKWIRWRMMLYHVPFLKGARTQLRSLSPSSRAVCFMQAIASLLQSCKSEGVHLPGWHIMGMAFCMGLKQEGFSYQLGREGEAGIGKGLQRVGWDWKGEVSIDEWNRSCITLIFWPRWNNVKFSIQSVLIVYCFEIKENKIKVTSKPEIPNQLNASWWKTHWGRNDMGNFQRCSTSW